ncbi:MAG: hypothetical protein JKY70_11980 [Mucilaginibacter sp.]|nr:hypothetical protein [Mucilaginibacter sp.]
MGLFSFFSQKGGSSPATTDVAVDPPNMARPLPEIAENIFIETLPEETDRKGGRFTAEYSNQTMETPNAVADNNINVLYAFLDQNHEGKGYDDALLNPDTSHLKQNLEALTNDLVRTLNKVKTFYEDFIQETEYHILSRGRSGMVDIVEELEMKKRIATAHMVKVREIEESTLQRKGDVQGILLSYTRGFNNGLAAISNHTILTKRF